MPFSDKKEIKRIVIEDLEELQKQLLSSEEHVFKRQATPRAKAKKNGLLDVKSIKIKSEEIHKSFI
jgi:hypothetical protein